MCSETARKERPVVRYRPGVPKPVRPETSRRRRPHRQRDAAIRFAVLDDWPDQLPITAGEVAVIETYLGEMLDELLSQCTAKRSRAPYADEPR